MRRCVDPLVALAPDGWKVTEGEEPSPDADINFHVPWHSLVTFNGTKNVALFTHVNPGQEGLLKQAMAKANHIICISKDGQGRLREHLLNEPQVPTSVVYPDVDGFHPRKIRVGIVGSEQPNGRKRSTLLSDLAWSMDLSPFHFIIVGQGWDTVLQHLSLAGVMVEHYEALDPQSLVNLYVNLDVLLSTGYLEGGPLPVVEALACGVPVLSPRYGFAADLLDDAYIYNTMEQLGQKLVAMAQPVMDRVNLVAGMTKEAMAYAHYEVFKKVLNNA